MSSVFTRIISGELPCYKIYEDEKTFAILDVHPETKGHTLVVPKAEVDKIYDLPEEDYIALMNTVKKLAAHMDKTLGVRTLIKVIGTDIPHAHVHLLPFDESWQQGRIIEQTDAEFREIQQKLAL